MTALSHLYIVESEGGLVKIGYSAKPKKRIAQIEMSIGTSVVNQYVSPLCLNARKIERHLHQHFAKHRQQGEWFAVKFPAVIKEIKQQTFQTDEPNRIMPFEFESHQIRTMLDEKGEPWFVAKDVSQALNISWSGHTLDKIRAEWRMMVKFTITLKNQHGVYGETEKDLTVINEPALYKLAFRSNKAKADDFTNWVAGEVLPSIRKTGQYSLGKKTLEKKLEQTDFEKFINDCFVPEPTHITRSRDIYLVYQNWCLQNDCPTRTIQWVGTQLGKRGYLRCKCPPKGVACWCGLRLNNPACPHDSTTPDAHHLLGDLQNHLSAVSKMLEGDTQYSNAELLSMVRTAHQKAKDLKPFLR